MNKNLENGVIHSIPRKWTELEVETLSGMLQDGIPIRKIADHLSRTETSVRVKSKRLKLSEGKYNESHREDKYRYNEQFVADIEPRTILDVYAGTSFYKSLGLEGVTDNDIEPGCSSQMDAFDFLCANRGQSFDLIDLDPYGSAFPCFDLALESATKGLAITFGEYGHKRWRRSDFVKSRYGIRDFEDFTPQPFMDYIVNRGLIFGKTLTPSIIAGFRNILRVYFLVSPVGRTPSGKEFFCNAQGEFVYETP